MDDYTKATIVFVLCLCCLGVGSCAGCYDARIILRREAVKQGKAEWVVVDEYGNTEFRWKE